MSEPWKDWIPGVLSDDQVKILNDEGCIEGIPDFDKARDYSSFNLSLSDEGYKMIAG